VKGGRESRQEALSHSQRGEERFGKNQKGVREGRRQHQKSFRSRMGDGRNPQGWACRQDGGDYYSERLAKRKDVKPLEKTLWAAQDDKKGESIGAFRSNREKNDRFLVR